MPVICADRVKAEKKSVWTEFTALAKQCNAVNIGQGFPDLPPPDFILKALKDALDGPNFLLHQYTRGFGHPRLVNALATMYKGALNHDIDPMTEISITVGGYSALFIAFFSFLNPGDEAIIIEPYFDCYASQVSMAGGVPIFVPLRTAKISDEPASSSANYTLDFDELEEKFSTRTKLLVLNNPNNPLGKVYTRDELTRIAKLAEKYDVIVISDEVYEWLVFPGSEMIRFASLPGMWNRTITIGSAGKVFSVTGWKTGWLIAPEHLMVHLRALHQNCIYTCPTMLQEALAIAIERQTELLGSEESYFSQIVKKLIEKREKMKKFLTEVGMQPIVPQGGYFMLADYSALRGPFEKSIGSDDDPKDYRFARWLCREKKLAGIPPSAFYSQLHRSFGVNLIRFCFFKDDSTLDAAAKIVQEWKSSNPT